MDSERQLAAGGSGGPGPGAGPRLGLQVTKFKSTVAQADSMMITGKFRFDISTTVTTHDSSVTHHWHSDSSLTGTVTRTLSAGYYDLRVFATDDLSSDYGD